MRKKRAENSSQYSDFVAFAYPSYAAFKAIKSRNVREVVPWLMYFITISFFNILENIGDLFISW